MSKILATKILIFLLFVCAKTFSQDIQECRKVVDLTTEAINQKTSKSIENHLAPNFSIAGQEGEIAKLVLQQLFAQLGETVVSSEELDYEVVNGELEIIQNIEYAKMGLKEASFTFDEQNMLKELSLFKMEVKSMTGKSSIVKAKNAFVELPFEMAGNLISVKVLVDGVKRNFILDSGSPKVILNSAYYSSDNKLKKTISSAQGVGGNISGMDIYKTKSLDFGGILMQNQEILTMDIAHLEEELEQKIYGLIGFELIEAYDLLFDYQKQILTLINPDKYEEFLNIELDYQGLTVVPFELRGHIPVIEVTISGQLYNLGIDSGAETNLLDDDLFESVKASLSKIEIDDLNGADNNSIKVKRGNIKRLDIGKKYFKKNPTLFSDISHLNNAYKTEIDGLIGFPVLSQQRTLISFKRKEMVFLE